MRGLVRRLLSGVSLLLARGSAAFTVVAASTLNLDELRLGIARSWSAFNVEPYEIAAGLMTWEQALADRCAKPGDRVLVAGSGTGRDVIALAERGCQVTGVEPSAEAADMARRAIVSRGLDAVIVDGFLEDVALPSTFDVIWFSFFCYSYIPVSRRRVEILRKASAHLAPGGRIIVTAATSALPPRTRLAPLCRLIGAACRTGWRLEDGDALNRMSGEGALFNYEHLFGPGELEREAAVAGLRAVAPRTREALVLIR